MSEAADDLWNPIRTFEAKQHIQLLNVFVSIPSIE